MKIKLSKNNYECESKIIKLSHVDVARLSPEEYVKRLKNIGWNVWVNKNNHYQMEAPNGIRLGFSSNNWEKNWQNVRKDLIFLSKDLKFIWQNPFKIPKNFNTQTLKIEEIVAPKYVDIQMPISKLPNILKNQIFVIDGEEKKIEDIDWATLSIMFDDGNVKNYLPTDKLIIRQYLK